MALMGSEALEVLWDLFKERLIQKERVYESTVSAAAPEEGAAVMTLNVQRQFRFCIGQILIPKNNTTDTLILPLGFRPAADYNMSGDGFSIRTNGMVEITESHMEDRILPFFYFTDDSPLDDVYAAGGDT